MRDLNKLIEEYSNHMDSIRYNKETVKESLPKLLEESEGVIVGFINWLVNEVDALSKDNAQLEIKLSLMKGRVVYYLGESEMLEDIIHRIGNSEKLPEFLHEKLQRALKNAQVRINELKRI